MSHEYVWKTMFSRPSVSLAFTLTLAHLAFTFYLRYIGRFTDTLTWPRVNVGWHSVLSKCSRWNSNFPPTNGHLNFYCVQIVPFLSLLNSAALSTSACSLLPQLAFAVQHSIGYESKNENRPAKTLNYCIIVISKAQCTKHSYLRFSFLAPPDFHSVVRMPHLYLLFHM